MNLKANIIASFDKNSIIKGLKQIGSSVGNVVFEEAEKNAKSKQTTDPVGGDDTKRGVYKGLEMVSNLGKTVGTVLKGIMGVALKAVAALGVIGAVVAGFQVFLNTAQKALSLISMLVRPISDAITMAIMPVFALLRPIVQVVNTMMMPFRQAAMQGMAAANSLISQGMFKNLAGEEGGGILIGEGLKGATASVGLMLSGILDVITKPFQNIEFMGIGQAISDGVQGLQGAAQVGVAEVVLFNTMLTELGSTLGDLSKKELVGVRNATRAIINDMQVDIRQMDITKFNENLTGIQTLGVSASDTLKESLVGDSNSLTAALLKTQELADKANISLDGFTSSIEKIIGIIPGRIDIDENMSRVFDRPKTLFEVAESMKQRNEIQDIFSTTFDESANRVKPGLFSKNPFEAVFENIKNFFNNDAKTIMGVVSLSFRGGLDTMHKDTIEAMEHSYIPDSFRAGLTKIHEDTKTIMDPVGDVPTTFSKGFDDMTKRTKSFSSSLHEVARIVDDARAKVESYARAYHSAMRRIESMSRASESRGI